MLGSDDFDFPKVCVEYQQDDQGQFVISNRMEEPFKSLYTGNKVGIRKRLSGYSYEARLLITLGQKDSIQEHMSCPCVIRQGLIEATRDVFSTIRDINMPFLNWQRDLGFIFLRSLSSEE